MKKRFIGIFSVILMITLFLTVPLAGCKTAAAETTAAETKVDAETIAEETPAVKQRTIGVTLIGASIPHCQEFAQAVQDYAEEKGDKVIVLDDALDLAKEISNIEDLVAMKVDGIVVEGYNYEATEAALKAAKEAGIPVAVGDGEVKSKELVFSNNTSDNYGAGVMCAEDMIAKMKSGEVFLITYLDVQNCVRRMEGFKDTMANYPDIKILFEEQTKYDIDKVAAQVEDLLQKNVNVNGFFGCSDREGVGASAAFISTGKDPKYIYSVDGNPDMIKLVSEGKAGATVKQNPYELGRVSVVNLYKALNNEPITEEERWATVPVTFIGPDNASEFLTE